MKAEKLFEIIGSDFYTGVPDSQLRPLCDFLMDRFGIDAKHHVIAANEGNCAALAAGYHLATGKNPVVYMQNSGEGNIINPAASLLHEKVYGIPCLFIVGWRGEPGIHPLSLGKKLQRNRCWRLWMNSGRCFHPAKTPLLLSEKVH